MVIKRSQKPQTMKPLKRLRLEDEEQPPNAETTMADRLSTIPEDLQLRILSSLDTKHAFQTSLLSKAWSSKCTHVPVLNFNSYSFKKLKVFDKFVYGALSVPRSAKVKKLTFKRGGICSVKILKEVFDFAFKQRVEELDVNISETRKDTSWPMAMSHTSWDSLKSLKLENYSNNGCSYWGPRSGSFKNLANLHLRKTVITDLDPFSGFPTLKKLTLVWCYVQAEEKTLNVHAPHLSELTLSYFGWCVNRCNLTTPNLKCFEFEGNKLPRLETHGLPVLETVDIRFEGSCKVDQERIMFEDLTMMFNALRNAKSVTIYSSIVRLLSLFPDELAGRCSPFQDLKSLKVDFSNFYMQNYFERCRPLSEELRHVSFAKGYLLQKSPDAKFTLIYPDLGPNVNRLHHP
ncbi:F-box/LRR-repeat protein At3g26922-like [Bidens hawaiensis]|uniref:F-box/LRR-repeat protein At3g26922-like n=1 Tax=Bidens hawaiensis TaxID=980011 RepID=UPI00404AE7F1